MTGNLGIRFPGNLYTRAKYFTIYVEIVMHVSKSVEIVNIFENRCNEGLDSNTSFRGSINSLADSVYFIQLKINQRINLRDFDA